MDVTAEVCVTCFLYLRPQVLYQHSVYVTFLIITLVGSIILVHTYVHVWEHLRRSGQLWKGGVRCPCWVFTCFVAVICASPDTGTLTCDSRLTM